MTANVDRMTKFFLYITSLGFVVILISTGYIFLYEKDYSFYLETACSPESETCFVRDCEEIDSCPPNNLETYRVFYVKAYDFAQCGTDSCLSKCTAGEIICEEVLCGDDPEDTCLVKEDTTVVEETNLQTSTSAEVTI